MYRFLFSRSSISIELFCYVFLLLIFTNSQAQISSVYTTNCQGGTGSVPTTKTIGNETLNMVWHDEFDGTEIDPLKWQACPEWFRQGGSYWEADNAWVNGCGKLKLKVSERNDSVFCGAIRTRNNYKQKYGYFEVRCKVPQIQGGWAAFWMMPVGNNPGEEGNDGTEIDIFESINGWNNKIQHALHWDGYGAEHQHTNKSMDRPDIYDNQMHTFGVKWTPSEYVFYIDDVETWRTSAGGVSDVEQYLKLTMEVSNQTWPGNWNNQVEKPIVWTVDYVRTYALPEPDCNGDIGGNAYIDNCETCVAGNTGLTACIQDCVGNWGGSAAEPQVTTSSTNEDCEQSDGTITFNFPDVGSRTNIEFSTDGGVTYPTNAADNLGSATVSNLSAGNYDLYARWGNDECPVDIGIVTVERSKCVDPCTIDPDSITVNTLYNQKGTDLSWQCVLDNNLIPLSITSTDGITGSDIDVNNNKVELGQHASNPIINDLKIHTLGNSYVSRSEFDLWTRWYQEDGNTQVFRLFKDEENVRNTRALAARIESFYPEMKRLPEAGIWHKWEGRYTIVNPAGCSGPHHCSIFQAKGNNVDHWSVMIKTDDQGNITMDRRQGTDFIIAQNMIGKAFDLKVLDNGLNYEVYLDNLFMGSGQWSRSEEIGFRWGVYVGESEVKDNIEIFVTGAKYSYVDTRDCNGDVNGTASLDDCNVCSGGLTGVEACQQDCNGDWGGTAEIDNCEVCSGGNTDIEVNDCITSIHSQSETRIRLFPNPTNEFINISENTNWKVIDVYGKILIEGEGVKIDLTNIPTGVYVIKTGLQSHKVVKR